MRCLRVFQRVLTVVPILSRCVESKPKARTSQKGARIAQAKLLYGDSSSNNALAIVVRQNKALQDQSRPRTPSASEVLMVASIDAGLLLNELIPAVAKLKMYVSNFSTLHSHKLLTDVTLLLARGFLCFAGSISTMNTRKQVVACQTWMENHKPSSSPWRRSALALHIQSWWLGKVPRPWQMCPKVHHCGPVRFCASMGGGVRESLLR